MQTLKLDPLTKDLELDEKGNPKFVTGKECLAQRVRNRLALWSNEWTLRPTEGIDWVGLRQNNNQSEIQVQIGAELLKDTEIKSIKSITLTLVETDEDVAKYKKSKRTLIVNVTIDSIYGEVSLTNG